MSTEGEGHRCPLPHFIIANSKQEGCGEADGIVCSPLKWSLQRMFNHTENDGDGMLGKQHPKIVSTVEFQ